MSSVSRRTVRMNFVLFFPFCFSFHLLPLFIFFFDFNSNLLFHWKYHRQKIFLIYSLSSPNENSYKFWFWSANIFRVSFLVFFAFILIYQNTSLSNSSVSLAKIQKETRWTEKSKNKRKPNDSKRTQRRRKYIFEFVCDFHFWIIFYKTENFLLCRLHWRLFKSFWWLNSLRFVFILLDRFFGSAILTSLVHSLALTCLQSVEKRRNIKIYKATLGTSIKISSFTFFFVFRFALLTPTDKRQEMKNEKQMKIRCHTNIGAATEEYERTRKDREPRRKNWSSQKGYMKLKLMAKQTRNRRKLLVFS